jgi:MoaA/NifB/PqqE/SkfB family radical SAM enzyme
MGVKAIQFTGGGEPLLHPDHEHIFRLALFDGFEIAVVTNGARMTPTVADLIGGRATWVRVSLDSGCADTYSKLRHTPEAEFCKITNAIQQLAMARDASTFGAYVGVGFVVCESNWNEVVDAARIARELGADNMRISGIFQSGGASYFSSFYDQCFQLCKEAESLSTDSFSVSNLFTDRIQDLQIGHPDHEFCEYQHFCTYIGADKWVYRCCNVAYTEHGKVGKITDDMPFDKIWDSSVTKAFNAMECPRCQFNAKNAVIRHAMKKPVHENFV